MCVCVCVMVKRYEWGGCVGGEVKVGSGRSRGSKIEIFEPHPSSPVP